MQKNRVQSLEVPKHMYRFYQTVFSSYKPVYFRCERSPCTWVSESEAAELIIIVPVLE